MQKGAGILSYLATFTTFLCPSFVGQYSSSMVRIWVASNRWLCRCVLQCQLTSATRHGAMRGMSTAETHRLRRECLHISYAKRKESYLTSPVFEPFLYICSPLDTIDFNQQTSTNLQFPPQMPYVKTCQDPQRPRRPSAPRHIASTPAL